MARHGRDAPVDLQLDAVRERVREDLQIIAKTERVEEIAEAVTSACCQGD